MRLAAMREQQKMVGPDTGETVSNSTPQSSQSSQKVLRAPFGKKLSPAKRALLEKSLKQRHSGKRRHSSESRIQSAGSAPGATPTYPLSFSQRRLWFLNQFETDKTNYNTPVAWRLEGSLNHDALQRALNAIVERHAVLRTSFALQDGDPVQVVAPQLALELPLTDLSAVAPHKREQQALELAAEEARRPFDLSRAPLLRCSLVRLDEQHHLLL
jgi:hypothetical protein